MEREDYMRRALELARKAASLGEVPVGAVIVRRADGAIVGEGFNQRESARHALAHAEMIAIDAACRALGGWRLVDCALFVTLEPCPMCSGAIVQARLPEIYYGANAPGGVPGDFFTLPGQFHPAVTGGLLREECTRLLSDFFLKLRHNDPNVHDNETKEKNTAQGV